MHFDNDKEGNLTGLYLLCLPNKHLIDGKTVKIRQYKNKVTISVMK